LVCAIVFILRNGVYVFATLAGFVLTVGGGWWAVTERGGRRVAGVVVLVAGTVGIAMGVIGAGSESWASVVRAAIAVALLAMAIVAGRACVLEGLQSRRPIPSTPGTPPEHPVLVCNPKSGGGKVERFGLVELAESLGVKTVTLTPETDLGDLARHAVDEGADCLGMAGGDGSQALVASIATERGVPFVCVSAGTRNHFALDLGLDREDPRKSVRAFRDAVERRIDFATVNDRFFVNNVSLGIYATIVQREDYRDAKVETTKRLLPDLLGSQTEPFDLQFVTPDGTEVDGAFLIQVSNNPYRLSAGFDMSQRRRLDSGQLGVIAVSASSGVKAADAIARVLAGKTAGSGSVFQFTCTEFEVNSRSGTAFAGVDGEALELPTPLRFQIHPNGLRLLMPEGNVDAAIRRQAREVHPADMVSLARGVWPARMEPAGTT
jgi:diacylglycerol kinase family enzyme